jgi:hypothetical protein
VATVKISGTIDAAVIDPVVPTLGQGGGTLPITLWIADVAPRRLRHHVACVRCAVARYGSERCSR